jgi:hypothetical protein
VGLDAGFHVAREALIDHSVGAAGLERGDHLGDLAPSFSSFSFSPGFSRSTLIPTPRCS